MTAPFGTISSHRTNDIFMTVKLEPLQNASAINIGVSNMDVTPNKSMFWKKNTVAGESFGGKVGKGGARKIGLRASAYNTNQAKATISVRTDLRDDFI